MANKKTKKLLLKKLINCKCKKGGKCECKFPARNLILLLVIIAVGFSGFYFKNKFVSASVNGRPVWRYKVVRELEKQAGKQAMEMLITKELISQEAKKQGVKVTADEVAGEMKKIEESLGEQMDSILEAQGLNKKDLEEEIRLQKLMEKMVGQDNIEVTEEEVDEYLTENIEYLGASPMDEETRVEIREQLKQQKMTELIQEWMQGLKENSKIVYF